MKFVAWAVGYVVFIALAITACGGGPSGFNDVVTLDGLTLPVTDEVDGPYSLVGSVLNLNTSGLKLNDGYEEIDVPAYRTTFNFQSKLPAGSDYDIRIVQQPAGQTCFVSYGHGKVESTVRNVIVNCGVPARFAYMLDTNDIIKFSFNPDNGDMSQGESTHWTDSAYSTSYYSLIKHPIQHYIFVFHAFEHKIEAFHVDEKTGELQLTDTQSVEYEDGNAFRVKITKNGQFIYIGGKKNGVYGFEFHPDWGTMTKINGDNSVIDAGAASGGVVLDDFEIDPNGGYVYGSNSTNGIDTLQIGADGMLHYVRRFKVGHGVNMMSASPDGKYLFASSSDQSNIQVIKINDGTLTQHVDVSLSLDPDPLNVDFWSGIQVDPIGKTLFVNEKNAGFMGAYPVSDLTSDSPDHILNAVLTATGSFERSFFSFTPDGKFVFSERHHPLTINATGIDGYTVDMSRTAGGFAPLALPPITSRSLAFLVY